MFFFFNDTATTEIYTLSLHDALPISTRTCGTPMRLGFRRARRPERWAPARARWTPRRAEHVRRRSGKPQTDEDRKSTRLNSSHSQISYAVFCLKKKNIETW